MWEILEDTEANLSPDKTLKLTFISVPKTDALLISENINPQESDRHSIFNEECYQAHLESSIVLQHPASSCRRDRPLHSNMTGITDFTFVFIILTESQFLFGYPYYDSTVLVGQGLNAGIIPMANAK